MILCNTSMGCLDVGHCLRAFLKLGKIRHPVRQFASCRFRYSRSRVSLGVHVDAVTRATPLSYVHPCPCSKIHPYDRLNSHTSRYLWCNMVPTERCSKMVVNDLNDDKENSTVNSVIGNESG